jgi:hypothetical protein
MIGTRWKWVTFRSADGPQDQFGVPPVDEHQRDAAAHGRPHVEGQRGGVIGRAGAHLHRAGRVIAAHQIGGVRGDRRDRPVHPLGPAGGAGGVHHGVAQHRVGDVGAVVGGDGVGIGLETVDRAADRQADIEPRRLGDRLGDGRDPGVADHRPGLAVLQDVGDLVGRQMPVHRRQPDAGPQGRGQGLDELHPVGTDQGDRVAGPEAPRPQQPDQPVGVGVDRGEAVGGSVRIVDGHPVRLHIGPDSDGHAAQGGLVQALDQLQIHVGEIHRRPREARNGLTQVWDRDARRDVEGVEAARIDMQLHRHPGAQQAAGVFQILFEKQIERAGRDEGRRQAGQVFRPGGRRVRRDPLDPRRVAQQARPAEMVVVSGPDVLADERMGIGATQVRSSSIG